MNTLRADESFLSYYQLDHDPFAARVPNFKFFPAQRKSVLGQLHHLVRHSQLALVITGPTGSGKTLLRQAFVASLGKEKIEIINLSAMDCLDSAHVLQVLANRLQIHSATPIAILQKIEEYSQQGNVLYLIVDDAEHLRDDVLHLLLNFANEKLSGLRLFLFGKASLLTLLENSVIGNEITFNLPLTPYTLDEVKEYLSIRLEGAGQTLRLFTAPQLDTIYQQSGGWPGSINQLARNCLLEAMAELTAKSTKAKKAKSLPKLQLLDFIKLLPKKHLMLASAVAACLLLLVFAKGSSSDDPAAVTASNTNPDTTTHVVPLTHEEGIDTGPITRAPLEGAVTDLNNTAHNNIAEQTSEVESPVTVDTTTAVTATQAALPTSVVVSSTETTEPTNVEVVSAQAPTSIQRPVNTQTQVNTQAATNTPVAVNQTPAPTQTPVAVVTTQPAKANNTTQTPPKPQAKPVVASVVGTNSWYSTQVNNHFTIQVSVSGAEQAARKIVTANGANYHYYKRSRAGKIDYVVSYGNFSNRAQAQQAIKNLPAAIQKNKPWIRTFASIKQDMAK